MSGNGQTVNYSGTYTYNSQTGDLRIVLSIPYGTMTYSYKNVFTTNNGNHLYLFPFEQTAGTLGNIVGTYNYSYGATTTVSVSGFNKTINSTTSGVLKYNANGTLELTATTVTTGAPTQTKKENGTWTYDSISNTYWIQAFGKTFITDPRVKFTKQ